MSKNNNSIIDKAIGKDGKLSVDAYWMRKILKDILAKIANVADSLLVRLANLKYMVNSRIDELDMRVEGKADKRIKVDNSDPWGILPNAYYIMNNSTPNRQIEFRLYSSTDYYEEFIIELTCTETPSKLIFRNGDGEELPIVWANGVPPQPEAGNTYIISIANGFGVYMMFPKY
jgi:hypothetical protein